MSDLPTRPPQRTLETAEFWDGCARGELVLPRCEQCLAFIWYPRLFCPYCASSAVSYAPVSGRGTVYTFTVTRKGTGRFRESGPYVLAMVRLDEGPTVTTNIIDVDPAALRIGDAVEVVFEPAGEHDAIPRFRPATTV